jgi:hypothetical protein
MMVSGWNFRLWIAGRLLTLSSTSKRDIEFSVFALADVLLLLSTRSRVGRGEWIGSSASDSLSPFFLARGDIGDSGECDFSPFMGLVVMGARVSALLPLSLMGDTTSVV